MSEGIVTHEHMNALPYIIAVDFDGTMVEDEFPNIGRANELIVYAIKKAQEKGWKVILWTCRDSINLQAAVDYCREIFGIEFDAVNKNIPETISMFNNDTRKVYANEYWDDKSTDIYKITGDAFVELIKRNK